MTILPELHPLAEIVCAYLAAWLVGLLIVSGLDAVLEAES